MHVRSAFLYNPSNVFLHTLLGTIAANGVSLTRVDHSTPWASGTAGERVCVDVCTQVCGASAVLVFQLSLLDGASESMFATALYIRIGVIEQVTIQFTVASNI